MPVSGFADYVSQMLKTEICIAGGGPAGLMLGYLLARSGVDVIVLEKHADFLRDFRGDTVHPSTLVVLKECGLLTRFNAIKQRRIQQGTIRIGRERISPVDFRGLDPFDYLALVPQWDFLDLLADESRKCNSFQLLLEHEVTDLVYEKGKVKGVRARTPDGPEEIHASLLVACDGRHSTVRKSLGLETLDLGAPMDALWFRLPRETSDAKGLQAVLGAGHMMVMIDRDDYWQIAYIVPKGSDDRLRRQPVSDFQQAVCALAPELTTRCSRIESWDAVKTLVVGVDRLVRWYTPGVLLIGDAAHTMSPIGGVGINLAIQDAVGAANVLARAIHEKHPLNEDVLARVQHRRERPTKIIQKLQLLAQDRLISNILESTGKSPTIPALLRWLLQFRWIRNIPARIIGYGFGRERVDTSHFQ